VTRILAKEGSMTRVPGVAMVLLALGVASSVSAQATRPGAESREEAAVAPAIEKAIREATRDGKLEILDPRAGETRTLTYVELHKAVKETGDGSLYACADFKDASGRLYDVDAFVHEADGSYVLRELVLHQVEGKDRIRAPKDAAPVPADTAGKVRAAIEAWARREAALRGGAFPFLDARAGAVRRGKVESVHQGVKQTGDGAYYACVDVRSEGKLYDLDVYARPSGEGFEVAEILVHKVDGKDRLREEPVR
jgi:hypothetical protein